MDSFIKSKMNRRTALKLSAGAALSAAFTLTGIAVPLNSAFGTSHAFVQNDIGILKRVLVHSPTLDDYLVDRTSSSLTPYLEQDIEASVQQHSLLLSLLRESGAETLELQVILESAIEEARKSGSWQSWLSVAHPRLSGSADKVTAETLLGRDRTYQYKLWNDGTYRNFFNDTSSSIWTRDAGVMTPKGLVVCNAFSNRRHRENKVLRFALLHSPMLSEFPVVFDAVSEGIILEGGDAQVVDEQTMFIGTGQRTDPRAAPMLAKRLGMDVVAVQVHQTDYLSRGSDQGLSAALANLRYLFLHLDTFFTHVNHKHALTMPWLLEEEYAGQDPLTRYIKGARADLQISAEDADQGIEFLKNFGKISIYRAGSGKKEDTGEMKLVDYIRSKGYKVTYVGGREPDDSADSFAFFLGRTLGELRRQAANVVATAPGKVIAYNGTPLTRAALEQDGIEVQTFEARELWAGHGGPHCLTMPLQRG
ncbi:arginine deiminase family protein [Desulfonatronovibrio magnus]|uniref:arginine deiminase family protein n=1 Tax=Desulfonatronovibrio magnus TaxID=698827 RepID=UPI0005EB8EAD|nr:arginine deiminase family protein [Desulfonatronovibrio magnus]